MAAVSDLKLRAGWGQTGNQDIANFASRGLYQSVLGTVDPNFTYDIGTAYDIYGNNSNLPSGYRRVQQANPNLKWETTTQTNLGVDFGLLDNRLTRLGGLLHQEEHRHHCEPALPGGGGRRAATSS